MFVLNETNVFRVCCTPVDMRQGILRLSQLVRSNDFNPSDGVVYVFYNRSRNRIKLLHWERCGFVVYHWMLTLQRLFSIAVWIVQRCCLDSATTPKSLF